MGKNTVPDPLQKRPSGCLDWVPSTLGKDFMIDKPQNVKNQSGFHASWDFRIVLLAFLTLVQVSFVPESSVVFSESRWTEIFNNNGIFHPEKKKDLLLEVPKGFNPPKKPEGHSPHDPGWSNKKPCPAEAIAQLAEAREVAVWIQFSMLPMWSSNSSWRTAGEDTVPYIWKQGSRYGNQNQVMIDPGFQFI